MSISVNDLKNGNLRKRAKSRKTLRCINGKCYDRNAQKKSLILAVANQQLQNASLNATEYDDTSLINNSTNLLETVGCSVLNPDNYTNYTIVEEVEVPNPNILTDLRNKKNELDLATNKFPNPDDPFYELDNAPDRATELERKGVDSILVQQGYISTDSILVQQGYIKIAQNLANLNIKGGSTQLKYFK